MFVRKLAIGVALGITGLTGTFLVAGRGLGELTGYFQASADTAVDGVVHALPRPVQDRKLDQDLRRVRQDVIDHQVQLNLSRGHLDQLQASIQQLESSLQRRESLLAAAYPVLKQAVDENRATVRFASTDYTLADYQRHVDDLLSQQDREQRELEIKREGLDRLERNSREAQQALADMRRALESAEQEVALLKGRREQAELESRTLDVVVTLGDAADDATAPVTQSLTQLRTEVEQAEARNHARRELAPLVRQPADNPLNRGWTRLESLKAIHDKLGADSKNAAAESAEPAEPNGGEPEKS